MKTSNTGKKGLNFLVLNNDTDDSSSEEENTGLNNAGNIYYDVKNAEEDMSMSLVLILTLMKKRSQMKIMKTKILKRA